VADGLADADADALGEVVGVGLAVGSGAVGGVGQYGRSDAGGAGLCPALGVT
jgi:hypothetical protein